MKIHGRQEVDSETRKQLTSIEKKLDKLDKKLDKHIDEIWTVYKPIKKLLTISQIILYKRLGFLVKTSLYLVS